MFVGYNKSCTGRYEACGTNDCWVFLVILDTAVMLQQRKKAFRVSPHPLRSLNPNLNIWRTIQKEIVALYYSPVGSMLIILCLFLHNSPQFKLDFADILSIWALFHGLTSIVHCLWSSQKTLELKRLI